MMSWPVWLLVIIALIAGAIAVRAWVEQERIEKLASEDDITRRLSDLAKEAAPKGAGTKRRRAFFT